MHLIWNSFPKQLALWTWKEALLIVKGAHLNAKTSQNLTPLNLADNNFENEIAELLIANGASEFVY